MRLPRPPVCYRRPTPQERRLTADDILHNRRTGWELSLARTGIAAADDIEARIVQVLEHLPDDFPDADTARRYVVDRPDAEIAAEILGSNPG